MISRSTCCGVFAGCLLLSCQGDREPVHPVREPITESVYASGIVKSDEQYEVFSNANGLVTQVLVTEGDIVIEGSPLLRLSDTTAKLSEEHARLAADYASMAANRDRLQELQVTIGQASSKLSNDSLLLERQERLWAQHIGTRNELEQRELNYRNSRGNYEAAVLRYTALERQIRLEDRQSHKSWQIARAASRDHVVRSAISGKVYSVLKKKGEMVTVQSPVAIVGDAGRFLLELQVDEFDIARVRTGLSALLTMDSYKGQVFEAVVSKIYPMMNAASKTFSVEATFTRPPPTLYPNLTCEANILVRTVPNGITIPADYLLPGNLVLLPGGKKVAVVTGARDYRRVEVLNGITENDIIVKPTP